jgi:hypothetical protein
MTGDSQISSLQCGHVYKKINISQVTESLGVINPSEMLPKYFEETAKVV